MATVKKFELNQASIGDDIKNYRFGRDWPVVYILINKHPYSKIIAYVGQTQNAQKRAKQHLKDKQKGQLKLIYIVADEDFNTSATGDIESELIRYLSGHQPRFNLLNKNSGLANAAYFDRERYRAKIPLIWDQLTKLRVVEQKLDDIENSNLFKYSPYKSLTDEQQEIVDQIAADFKARPQKPQLHLIKGQPGTGKTVLAAYLMKKLADDAKESNKNPKIGLVVPNRRLQKTLSNVIGGLAGFRKNMVMSPHQVVGNHYDILIVDEAHLLGRAVSQARIGLFRQKNQQLGLEANQGTQLDWVRLSSNHQILLYDADQAIRPANIRPQDIESLPVSRHQLNQQCRVRGGQQYIDYVKAILQGRKPQTRSFENYEFHFCQRIDELVELVQDREDEFGLSRILAGWAWPWNIDDEPDKNQIQIDSIGLTYKAYSDRQSSLGGDIRLKDVTREVNSIHTIQGMDLNYAGVIIGPDLTYDSLAGKIVANKSNYYDRMGKSSLADESELETYIKRIYLVLLTRAIHGTFIYVCDPKLKLHLKQFFKAR